MKAIVVILFLLLIAIALFLGLSMPSAAPPPSGLPAPTASHDVSAPVATGAEPAAKPASTATAAPVTGADKPAEGVVTSTIHDVNQVADYATGYTPLKVKQRSEKKIRDINATHNAEVEKAINEN